MPPPLRPPPIKDAVHEAELRAAVASDEGLQTLAEAIRGPVEARIRKDGLKPQAVPEGAVAHKLEVRRFLDGDTRFGSVINALTDDVVASILRMQAQVSSRKGFVSGQLTIEPFEEGGRRGLFFVERAYTSAPPAPPTPPATPKEGQPS